jgi:hypothetical protein
MELRLVLEKEPGAGWISASIGRERWQGFLLGRGMEWTVTRGGGMARETRRALPRAMVYSSFGAYWRDKVLSVVSFAIVVEK